MTKRIVIEAPEGFACHEAALFAAQLDDLTRRLRKDLAGIRPDELAWQSAPGMNTIGMLLAHLAIVEVFWMQRGPLGEEENVKGVLGVGVDDDGMPLPAGGAPPDGLSGRDLAWFERLHDKARAFVIESAKRITDEDLSTERTHSSRIEGKSYVFNIRWVLHHVVEHFAGHYGQILMLRHMHADAIRKANQGA